MRTSAYPTESDDMSKSTRKGSPVLYSGTDKEDEPNIAAPYKGSALEEAHRIESLQGPLRKTVQISSQIDSHGKYLVLALCDDGTIWQLDNLYREGGKEPFWFPFPIPPVGHHEPM